MLDEKYSDILNNKLLNFKINKLDNDFKNLKMAYPVDNMGLTIPGEHNLPKWVQALKDIYFKNLQQKMTWKQAFDSSTSDWNPIERNDFNNWVNFYQQNNHLKYKKANWYLNEDVDEDNSPLMPGYAIPNAYKEEDSVHREGMPGSGNPSVNDISSQEKNNLLKKLKNKVISRLDSLEKLLRTEEGYLLSEKENDSLIDTIHKLKKSVYNLKRQAGEVFYQDLIVREANSLANKGFYKAASFLYVTAQQNAAPPQDPASAAPAAPAAPGTDPGAATPGITEGAPDASGAPPAAPPATGAPPVTGDAAPAVGVPGMPPAPISPDAGGGTAPPAIGTAPAGGELGKSLTEALGFGEASTTDNNSIDDGESSEEFFVFDDSASDENNLSINEDNEDSLLSFAQMPPPPMPPKMEPEKKPMPPVEMALDKGKDIPPADITVTDGFDKNLESVLSKITVEDVLRKMEQISKIFKTREIPRQLSVVDMMLDHLGLASFFPSLSEATNKALESNNYILTRMEDIIMQLSGAIKTKGLDLSGSENDTPEHALGVRKSLEDQEKTDQQRKEMRKELADKALEERAKEETPDLEVTEDELEAPPPPPPSPPQVAKPVPPPAI